MTIQEQFWKTKHCLGRLVMPLTFSFLILACSGASARSSFDVKLLDEVVSFTGDSIDLPDLRTRLYGLENHLSDNELDVLISFQPISDQIIPVLLGECGFSEDFVEFSTLHGSSFFSLTDKEKIFLRACLYHIFAAADQNFGFSAPGLYQRFSTDHLDEIVDLGYRCGYRNQDLFVRFSLAVWLVEITNIQQENRFTCYGDLSSNFIYSNVGHSFGVTRIIDEIMTYWLAFSSWEEVVMYQAYRETVLSNRRAMSCDALIDDLNGKTINEEDLAPLFDENCRDRIRTRLERN